MPLSKVISVLGLLVGLKLADIPVIGGITVVSPMVESKMRTENE